MKIVANTSYHPLPDGGVTLLGARDRVTPTMTLVELEGERLLIDCGVRGPNDPLPSAALAVETLLITHAHSDHIAGLPTLLAKGKVKRVLATAPTLEITAIQIEDSYRIYGDAGSGRREFRRRFNEVVRSVRYGETVYTGERSNGLRAKISRLG